MHCRTFSLLLMSKVATSCLSYFCRELSIGISLGFTFFFVLNSLKPSDKQLDQKVFLVFSRCAEVRFDHLVSQIKNGRNCRDTFHPLGSRGQRRIESFIIAKQIYEV